MRSSGSVDVRCLCETESHGGTKLFALWQLGSKEEEKGGLW